MGKSKHLTTIKVSACKHLLTLKIKYLNVGLYCLLEEAKKEKTDVELVFSLCQLVVSTKSLIYFLKRMIEKGEGNIIKVTGDEASLIKVYIRIFKASKREMMLKHNLSVEIH